MMLTTSPSGNRSLPRPAVLLTLSLGLVVLTCNRSSASSPPAHQGVLKASQHDHQQQTIASCANAATADTLADRKLEGEQNKFKAQEAPAAREQKQAQIASARQRLLEGHTEDLDGLCQQKTHVEASDKLCNSKSHTWHYEYFEEQVDGFDVRVLENSLDERFANVIHTSLTVNGANIDTKSFDSGDPREDVENMNSVAGQRVDEAKCEQHLKEMLLLLDEINAKLISKRANSSVSLNFDERHLRLARALDSYGRYETGHLSGKTHAIGQYDQCVSTHLLLKSREDGDRTNRTLEKVPSRYCWARLSIDKHLNDDLKQRVKSEFEVSTTNLMAGVCLPQSCHSKTFARNKQLIQRLIDSQFRLPKSLYIDDTLEVDFVYCLADEDSAYSSLPFSGRLAVFFVIGWLLLTIYATCVPAGRNSWLECLSLHKSWLDFVGEPDEEMPREQLEKLQLQRRQRTVELDTLNPVKVFGCAFVVLGHSLAFHLAFNQSSLRAFYMMDNDPSLTLILLASGVVDTFFVITGILMGYIVMRRARKGTASEPKSNSRRDVMGDGIGTSIASSSHGSRSISKTRNKQPPGGLVASFFKQWAQLVVTRQLRLLPLYFIVFWVKKSVLISYFADKPQWDAGFNKDTLSGACRRESWTTPFTMMAAFLPLSKQCFPQAWSLASDLFLSLTISPIMLIMPRYPKVAFTASLSLIVISNLWVLNSYNAVDPEKLDPLADMHTYGFVILFGSIHHLYTYPHFRLSPILIGLIAGYYLYYYGEQPHGEGKVRRWPSWFSGFATKCVIVTIAAEFFIFAFMPYMREHIAPYHRLVPPSIFSVSRIVWSLCNVTLLLRMVSDWRQSFWMKMSAGRFWKSAVRLNLAILLVHIELIFYLVGSSASFIYFNKHNIWIIFTSTYFFSIPLAIFLHVVYENPIDKLVRRYILPRLFA